MSNLNHLIGQTFDAVYQTRYKGSVAIVFRNDSMVCMIYDQEASGNIVIEGIKGDLDDLIGSPISVACRSDDQYSEDEGDYFETWSWHVFRTAKGSVTVEWVGSSEDEQNLSPDVEIMFTKKGLTEKFDSIKKFVDKRNILCTISSQKISFERNKAGEKGFRQVYREVLRLGMTPLIYENDENKIIAFPAFDHEEIIHRIMCIYFLELATEEVRANIERDLRKSAPDSEISVKFDFSGHLKTIISFDDFDYVV